MYEKLDKIRADLERAKKKRAEADAKVKQLEQKLKEAENTQILAEVGALKLTPEQLAQFLKLAANGQLPLDGNVAGMGTITKETALEEDVRAKDNYEERNNYERNNYEEREDFEYEEQED